MFFQTVGDHPWKDYVPWQQSLLGAPPNAGTCLHTAGVCLKGAEMNQVRQLGMRFFLKSGGCRTQSEEKKVGKPAPSQAVNGSEVEEIPKQYSVENRQPPLLGPSPQTKGGAHPLSIFITFP